MREFFHWGGICFRLEEIERPRTVFIFEAMKAIRVSSFGGPEVLKLVSDVPIPSVSIGQVRIYFYLSHKSVITKIKNTLKARLLRLITLLATELTPKGKVVALGVVLNVVEPRAGQCSTTTVKFLLLGGSLTSWKIWY